MSSEYVEKHERLRDRSCLRASDLRRPRNVIEFSECRCSKHRAGTSRNGPNLASSVQSLSGDSVRIMSFRAWMWRCACPAPIRPCALVRPHPIPTAPAVDSRNHSHGRWSVAILSRVSSSHQRPCFTWSRREETISTDCRGQVACVWTPGHWAGFACLN